MNGSSTCSRLMTAKTRIGKAPVCRNAINSWPHRSYSKPIRLLVHIRRARAARGHISLRTAEKPLENNQVYVRGIPQNSRKTLKTDAVRVQYCRREGKGGACRGDMSKKVCRCIYTRDFHYLCDILFCCFSNLHRQRRRGENNVSPFRP